MPYTHSRQVGQAYILNEPTVTIAFTAPPIEGCHMPFLTKSAQQPIPLSAFFLVAHICPENVLVASRWLLML